MPVGTRATVTGVTPDELKALGTSIILANTYHSEFAARFDAEDRAAVGPEVALQLDDPTVKLNADTYAEIKSKVLALPDGEAILARAENAQGESVVLGIRHIYYGAVAAAVVCLFLALGMKELPLRKTVMGGPGEADPKTGTAGVVPEPLPGVVGH
jgi:hypothetical protein